MKVGFIGLGSMGAHMARNLHRQDLLTGVWNRTANKAQTLAAELNVIAADTLTQLATQCDTLVLCVSADDDVRAVITALKPALQPDTLVIDCSTVSSDTARWCAAELNEVDCQFMDAPVTGGVEGARLASLAILVGSGAAAFAQAQPVLQAMGKTVTHFGSHGAGQAAKATNQILCAGAIQAAAEAMAFARAEGLPLDKIISTLSQGAGSSWYFNHRAQNMISGDYSQGFKVALHDKDLKICRDMARTHDAQLPLIEMTLIHYRRLMEQGYGNEDISSLYRLKEPLFKS